jgi:hemerythrin
MSNFTTPSQIESPFHWTEALSIGHEQIDADHQDIFEIANRLQEEMQGEEPEHSIVGEVLVELIEHTGGHFMREESLMEAIHFPYLEQHKREHKLLMEKVNTLHRRYMDGRGDVVAEVIDFLRHAMVPHIMHSDMGLGKQMRGEK